MGFKTTKMHTGNKDSWAPEPLSQGTTSRGHQVHPLPPDRAMAIPAQANKHSLLCWALWEGLHGPQPLVS